MLSLVPFHSEDRQARQEATPPGPSGFQAAKPESAADSPRQSLGFPARIVPSCGPVPPIHVLKSAQCFGDARVRSAFLSGCPGGRCCCGLFSRRGSRGGGWLNNFPKAEPHYLCPGPLLLRPRSVTPCLPPETQARSLIPSSTPRTRDAVCGQQPHLPALLEVSSWRGT